MSILPVKIKQPFIIKLTSINPGGSWIITACTVSLKVEDEKMCKLLIVF